MAKLPAISNCAKLGAVHLRVTDIAKASTLWLDVIGLTIVGKGENRLDLGVGDRTLITLHGRAQRPAFEKQVGLFHLALELPSRLELARVASRLRRAGRPWGGQDHLLTLSIYSHDSDGNGIEFYVSTPERATLRIVDGHPSFTTLDGASHSGVAPLELRELMTELEQHGDGDGHPPPETKVSHIHMRSNDPERTIKFYTDIIGFRPHIASSSFGMFDCGTEANTHMIAFNSWGGRDLAQPSAHSAGLAGFAIELPSPELEIMRNRLAEMDAADWYPILAFDDPDGNSVIFVPSPRVSTE